MSYLCALDDQNTGASALASVLPVNFQGRSPLRLTGLISLPSKGLSGVFSSTAVWRHQFFGALPSLWSSSNNRTWLLDRPYPWLYRSLLGKQSVCFLTHWLCLSKTFRHGFKYCFGMLKRLFFGTLSNPVSSQVTASYLCICCCCC